MIQSVLTFRQREHPAMGKKQRASTVVEENRIVRTRGICGGDARIAGTRIPVWALESQRRLGISEQELLQDFPRLSHQDLQSAWAWTEAHREEVERAIQDNEE